MHLEYYCSILITIRVILSSAHIIFVLLQLKIINSLLLPRRVIQNTTNRRDEHSQGRHKIDPSRTKTLQEHADLNEVQNRTCSPNKTSPIGPT
jgi:hypothetical protein